MVRLILIGAVLLTGCGSPPAAVPEADATADASYTGTVGQLAALAREANDAFHKGKPDDAAALIEKGEPLESQVLSVNHPTLAATEAASDLDDLYGRMLLSNRHYVWAQSLFQKNLARWKYWKPQTPDTLTRMKQAEAAIAECERHIAE